MLYKKRPHSLTELPDLATLAEKLHGTTWTTCSGWRVGDLLVLNDSTGPDGAQEYAIVRGGIQIESLTVSWYDSAAELLSDLTDLASGKLRTPMGPVEIVPHPDGYCQRCA